MRRLSVLLYVVLSIPTARGQWLEKVILLPDSLGGQTRARSIACDHTRNVVYIGGEYGRCVVAVDGVTNERIARIPTGSGVRDMLYVEQVDKLYCACGGWYSVVDSTVTVIDCGSNRAIGAVAVGRNPSALSCCPDAGKVYCANTGDGTVSVLGVHAESVLATVPVGAGPCKVVHNPVVHKVYVANYGDGTVSAIDCFSSAVVATTWTGGAPRSLCVNPDNNKLYVADEGSSVVVLDCSTDSVLAWVTTDETPVTVMYDSAGNQVYCAHYNGACCVIDGATNEVTARFPVGYHPRDVCYDPGTRSLYWGCYVEWVHVVSCTTNSIVGSFGTWGWVGPIGPGAGTNAYAHSYQDGTTTVFERGTGRVLDSIALGRFAFTLACDSSGRWLYVTQHMGHAVSVFDCFGESLVGEVRVGEDPQAACYNPRNNCMYIANRWSNHVSVIDVATRRVDSIVIGTGYIGQDKLLLNSAADKLYCTLPAQDAVAVIDCRTNTLKELVPVGDEPCGLCLDTRDNKVYCVSFRGFVTAIDAAIDTVVATITVDQLADGICYAEQENKMYCSSYSTGAVTAIDCATDTVVATVRGPASSHDLCYDPDRNRVYCGDYVGTSVFIIDCATDSIVAAIPVGQGMACGFTLNRGRGLMFCAAPADNAVAVIDCAADTLVALVSVPDIPQYLVYSPRTDRVYAACNGGSAIAILRASSPGIESDGGRGRPVRDEGQTIVRSYLSLSRAQTSASDATWRLLDLSGREVRRLRGAVADIHGVPAGVYFLCPVGLPSTAAVQSRRRIVVR